MRILSSPLGFDFFYLELLQLKPSGYHEITGDRSRFSSVVMCIRLHV